MEADNANPIIEIGELLPSFTEQGTNGGAQIASSGKRVPLGSLSTASHTISRVPIKRREILKPNLSSIFELGKDVLLSEGPEFPGQMENRLGSVALAFRPVRHRLDSMKLDFSSTLEVSKDPEEPDSEAVLVAVSVRGIPYDKLLRLWDDMSNAFSSCLDEGLRGKVHLVLRQEE